MTLEIRYVSVNGARLGYEVHSENSGKPPAIFVHGYSGRSTNTIAYRTILSALAKEFTVYALDLRGHGASASEVDGSSMAAAADDVAAVANQLGLVGALYIGHSFGGFTGMYCEVRHPRTFSAMCLITPGAASGGAHAGPDAGVLFVEFGRDREVLQNALGAAYADPANAAAHVEAILVMDRRVHEGYFAEYPHTVILDEIRSVEIPVLVLNGAQDAVVPLSAQHETAMAFPNCKEVIFTTQGHSLPCDSGDLAAREIIAFWKHDVGTTRPAIGQ